MSANPAEIGVTAWKQQMDVAMQIADAIVEGAEKAHQIQLAAGADTQAWLESSRKALAEAHGIADLAAVESRLMTENMGKVALYWSQLAANARDTQGRVVELLMNGAGTPLFGNGGQPTSSQDALNMMDAGFKQWVEALRALYGASTTKH